MTVKLRVLNKSKNELPKYACPGDSGMDVRADLRDPTVLSPGQRCVVPTGLYLEIPVGYEIQVRSRSGLAAKQGITVLNAPGTIDSNYRGELLIILLNTGDSEFQINPGDRVAQIVLAEVPTIEWETVQEINIKNDRGGGLGHTGIS